MKKVLLTGAALMAFAAASFAQNEVTVNQVGSQQTATPTQSGNKQKATINQNQGTQTNYGNYANTSQTGSTNVNTITVNQNDGAKGNFTTVKQENGSGNVATVSQSGNSGSTGTDKATSVGKAGDGNSADVYQTGLNGQSTVEQNGNGSRSYNNTARSEQFGAVGDANTSVIKQNSNSHDNKATTYQGQGNTPPGSVAGSQATIEQIGGPIGSSEFNEAVVDQDGSTQQGTIQQNNGSYRNKATINQNGGTGQATIKQIDNAYLNEAKVTQSGGDHTADILESGDSHNNYAEVTQSGSGADNARISQIDVSASNFATIEQSGTSATNNATITQQRAYNDGHGGNRATINQYAGSNNTAEITQGVAGSGDIASGNMATLMQSGSNNMAKLAQQGDMHEADVKQQGSGNTLKGLNGDTAMQMGESNKLFVTQNSGSNMAVNTANIAEVSQSGVGNTATINQTYAQP